jgi:hypothetical protein
MSTDPTDPRNRAAWAAARKTIGPDGRVLPGAPGRILMKPVTSARYETDLVQAQRGMRAQAASEAASRAGPKKARLLYKSTSLPSPVLPDDDGRRADLERWEAKELAEQEHDFDFSVDGLRTPEQISKQLDQYDRRRQAKERAIHENLMPANGVTHVLGRVTALPWTALGAATGSLNVLGAKLAGRGDARITRRGDQLNFESGLLGGGESAFTLGDSVLYGPNGHPDTPSVRRYDHRLTPVALGDHEPAHSRRYSYPFFPPMYVGAGITDAINGKPNRYEVEADDFAEEAYRRRRK